MFILSNARRVVRAKEDEESSHSKDALWRRRVVRWLVVGSLRGLRQSGCKYSRTSFFHRIVAVNAIDFMMSLVGSVQKDWAQATQSNQNRPENLKQVSLEELGQIEVTTASKVPVKATRTPAAIYVITQEDIRRSGATSIPEALRMAPGVEVARVDSNTWSLGVRGFQSTLSRSVLVLIDGRSVYTPLFAGVYWQVQDTLLEDIDRIEVIRGPRGTILGANALNAVINIITKRAQETHGT